MAPPQLGEEQIVAGPDWTDERDAQGRILSLQTPVGEYSVATLFARLPMEQWPDVLVCLVDSSRRNLPRDVGTFRGPKVLLLADTHHLQSPLMTMIRYAAAEAFDRIVFLYDRHHAPIFGAAGFRNLYWFPGLTFPHADAVVRAARSRARPDAHVAFVGQAAKHHPRRARLLNALVAGGVELAQRALPQEAALGFYGSSAIGFNASLNGDLNLRTFEVLASGALLLTDELGRGSGLAELAGGGAAFATYGNTAELVAKARHYLARPEEARQLAAAGAAWFDRTLNAARRRAMFRALAVDGVAPEPFPLPEKDTTRIDFGDTDRLLTNVMVYEAVQELHRTEETVTVAQSAGGPACFAQLCATLPRVAVRAAGAEACDLLVVNAHEAAVASQGPTGRVWCWDATEAQRAELAQTFSAAGFSPASDDLAVFCRATPAATREPNAAELAAEARASFGRGDLTAALAQGRAALQRDGNNVAALTLLAELSLLKQGGPLAEKLLRQARVVAPDDALVLALLGEALLLQRKLPEADLVLARAVSVAPTEFRALRALAALREAQGRADLAVRILEEAVRLHPQARDLAAQLGRLLRRAGQVLEGLEWQRRALGASDPIEPVDVNERPVRVALLAQHPQGWTSLESVWRALSADADFSVTVLAAPYLHPYPPEGGPEAIYDFLARQGVPFARWNEASLEPGFADVVFVQNPYDVTRPAPLRTPQLLKLVPRLAYVPYGLEIGGGDANAENQFNLPLQQHAWAVFARSTRHRAMFERHCRTGAAHVAVTGHPRLDSLRELAASAPDAEFAAFARGRRVVFWNPQFDIRADGTGYSTFLLWQEFLLQEFARRQDLAFVIRPHPLFFGTLEARRIWSRAQVEDFLRRVAEAGNVLIDRRASYLPVFAASHAMLSDASTFLLEYAATGKPLLYLHNPRGPSLNDDGEFVRAHSYTAERAEEIAAFLDLVARGEDPRGEARRRAYPEVMHCPAEGVGEAIKHHLRQRLAAECARPVAVTVHP